MIFDIEDTYGMRFRTYIQILLTRALYDFIFGGKKQQKNIQNMTNTKKTSKAVHKNAFLHATNNDRWVAHHTCFEISFAVVIVLNAVQMGTSVEFPEAPLSHVWHVLEHFFTAVFFLEMSVKMMGLKFD